MSNVKALADFRNALVKELEGTSWINPAKANAVKSVMTQLCINVPFYDGEIGSFAEEVSYYIESVASQISSGDKGLYKEAQYVLSTFLRDSESLLSPEMV